MSGRARARRRACGFTLIELAVVVAIVGLLLGGLLVPLATQVELNRMRTTQRQLDDIREALYGFAVVNGRLPCPDTDATPDGSEDLSGTSCAGASGGVASGALPWADLGVERQDAWGRGFRYLVDAGFADQADGTGCGVAATGVSFELCADGALQVFSTAPGGSCSGTGDIAPDVPAAVLSQGANGGDSGSFSTDEQDNADSDACLVSKDYQSSFDDLVSWISPHILKLRMIQAERLP